MLSRMNVCVDISVCNGIAEKFCLGSSVCIPKGNTHSQQREIIRAALLMKNLLSKSLPFLLMRLLKFSVLFTLD